MTYIYLNTYPNGYLYVGSHTWDGPIGQLDPSYHGSSFVAEHYNWFPIKEEILEADAASTSERYWIEYYANMYGIADCASVLFNHCRNWMDKFPKHGRMINCHANDASQARIANRKKMQEDGFTDSQKLASSKSIIIAQKISVEKRKQFGESESRKAAAMDNILIAQRSRRVNGASDRQKEHCRKVIKIAQKKSCELKGERGLTEKQRLASLSAIASAQKSAALKVKTEGPTELQVITYRSNREIQTKAAHSKEAIQHMVDSRKKNGYKSVKATFRRVQVNGKEFNSVKEACRYCGNENWTSHVCKMFRLGLKEVEHHGFIFILK